MQNEIARAPECAFSLQDNEDLYQDAHTGGWIACFRQRELWDDGECWGAWHRLGTYGSREAAIAALLECRRDGENYGADFARGVE